MPEPKPPVDLTTARLIERAVSPERLASYRARSDGDLITAIELYRWYGELSGAMMETLGHVEVLLRNALAVRMAARQQRLGRSLSWLEDPTFGLDQRARDDIVKAQQRVRAEGKPTSDGQVISELSFGFWRFMLARRYQGQLWPDLATGFPHAPSRRRQLIEDPVVRLHKLRNRLAHHQRVWSEPVAARLEDCLLLTGYIDPAVRDWIASTSPVSAVLAARPNR